LNTFWVYENIKKQWSFYNKLDVLLLLCSGVLWKKNHPKHHTVLYCDEITSKLIDLIEGRHVWDEIRLLPNNKHIDKSVFWASSKLQILRNTKEPTIVMDHDFLVYKNLDKYIKDTPLFAHEENGKRYYPTAFDPFIKEVQDIVPRPYPKAINCCFTYFPDHKFANEYAKTSLTLMERFTKLKVPSSKYLIFAEQLLLKHLLDHFNIEYNTLLNQRWNCLDKVYEDSNKGEFSFEDSLTVFRHYWMEKPLIKNEIKEFGTHQEVRILENILKPYKVDIEEINKL